MSGRDVEKASGVGAKIIGANFFDNYVRKYFESVVMYFSAFNLQEER